MFGFWAEGAARRGSVCQGPRLVWMMRMVRGEEGDEDSSLVLTWVTVVGAGERLAGREHVGADTVRKVTSCKEKKSNSNKRGNHFSFAYFL